MNPFKLLRRNRRAQAAGLAMVAVVLLGTVLLVPHLVSHPGQTVANALPSGTSEPLSIRPIRHPAAPAQPSPASKKAAQQPSSAQRPSSPPASKGTGAPHVMIILEENKGYAATLGSCGSDPYWCSLAKTYASDTSWFGVNHPSAPNYVALVSGATYGLGAGDCTPYSSPPCGPTNQRSLGGQLNAAGIPWVAYMESMPAPCSTVNSSGLYAAKHNPFVFFTDVYRVPSCAQHVLPYPGAGRLVSTLNGANPPDFVWITPNLTNDMHNGSVQQGDAWLRANLAPVLASPWFTAGNSTVIVTMDENDSQKAGTCCSVSPGGQIPMTVISSDAAGKASFAATGDHYGLLRSIEEVFGLPLLAGAATSKNGDLAALFGS